MARILGMDYGRKRTGLAVTDPLQIIVNQLETVETSQLMPYLENYFAREEVEKIVIGQALHVDGTPVSIEKDILEFIKKLNKQFPALLVDRQDEQFTSEEAKSILFDSGIPQKKRREKGLIDKLSAALILQKYLGHL